MLSVDIDFIADIAIVRLSYYFHFQETLQKLTQLREIKWRAQDVVHGQWYWEGALKTNLDLTPNL